MKRGTDNASLFDESVGPEQQGYSSNMKLMMIVAAFLIVTIGLILVQPNVAPNQLVENEPTELTKTADLVSVRQPIILILRRWLRVLRRLCCLLVGFNASKM